MDKRKILPYVEVIASMLVFGTVGIVRRSVAFPSGFLAMTRGYVGCAVILLILSLMKKKPSFSAMKKNALPLLLSGAFIGINWIFLFESFRYTTVATATLCYYMAPVFVVLFSPLILGEKVTPVKLCAVVAAVLGMVLVSEPWSEDGDGKGLLGIILALVAALFYAAVTITNKKLCDISSFDRTLAQLFIAACTVLPYTLAAERITSDMFDTGSVVMTLLLGALHTGIAYVLFFSSIEKLPAVSVSLFGYIDPISAVILSVALLGEEMTALAASGAAVIIISMIVSELFENQFSKPKTNEKR